MSSAIGARHPVGLWALCAIELFERFAASLLGSLLLLYLNERLDLTGNTAMRWSRAFNAAVYLSSVLGGVLADRALGTRRAVILGVALLAAGYVTLSLDAARLLYPAAALLFAGHALFKPSISAAVGKLYAQNDPQRDDAYSLFYVVFNTGKRRGAGSAEVRLAAPGLERPPGAPLRRRDTPDGPGEINERARVGARALPCLRRVWPGNRSPAQTGAVYARHAVTGKIRSAVHEFGRSVAVGTGEHIDAARERHECQAERLCLDGPRGAARDRPAWRAGLACQRSGA